MKKITHTNGIRIVLFATFLLIASINLSAQYKLELEWQKEPGGNIVSIAKSDNDSLIYVATPDRVRTIRTLDGEEVKTDVVDGTYNMFMSRDGKTMVASSGTGAGLLDPKTFQRVYWDFTTNIDYNTLSYNEKQNKYLICGNTSNNPISSFIKIYDANTKSLFKEFNPSYFGQHSNLIRKGMITNDGKYIIYGMVSNIPKWKYYLKMIDLDGNVVKDFGETSSLNFTFTNDGKTLIYFMSDGIHFLDLENMKESEISPTGGIDPTGIEMSSDGKFMMLGFGGSPWSKITNSLIYYDLETKKYFTLNDNSTWRTYKLKKDNSNLFYGIGNHLYKFHLTPNTSVSNNQIKLEWTIQSYGNELILSSQNNFNPNLEFRIISIDGKIQKQILPHELQLTTNSITINISSLIAGLYFLEISDNQKVVYSSKFNKVN